MSSIHRGRLCAGTQLGFLQIGFEASKREEDVGKDQDHHPTISTNIPTCYARTPSHFIAFIPSLFHDIEEGIGNDDNSPPPLPPLSPTLAACASYRLLASRTASYPAVSSTMAMRDAISEPVPVTRQRSKTMHKFVVSHVKSIYRRVSLCDARVREGGMGNE